MEKQLEDLKQVKEKEYSGRGNLLALIPSPDAININDLGSW